MTHLNVSLGYSDDQIKAIMSVSKGLHSSSGLAGLKASVLLSRPWSSAQMSLEQKDRAEPKPSRLQHLQWRSSAVIAKPLERGWGLQIILDK